MKRLQEWLNEVSSARQKAGEDMVAEWKRAEEELINEKINPGGKCGCCQGKGGFGGDPSDMDSGYEACMTCNGSGKG